MRRRFQHTVTGSNGFRPIAAALVLAACWAAGLPGPRLASAAENPQGAALSLDFVPNEAELVIMARPAELLAIKKLEPIRQVLVEVGLFEPLGLPPEEIEEFKLAMVGNLRSVQHGQPPWAILVLRAKKPFEWSKFARSLIGESKETIGAGQSYHAAVAPRRGLPGAYWYPDDYTIVMAPQEHITETFALRGPLNGPAWAEKWNSLAKGPAALMVSMNMLSYMLETAPPADDGPGVAADDADALLLTLNAEGGEARISGLLECRSAEAAARVQTRLEVVLKQATRPSGSLPTQPGWAVGRLVFPELIAKTRIVAQGDTLRSVTAVDDDLGRKFQESVGPARLAARRAQSVNKLKQITIAMLNHHDAYKRFPAAAEMGPDGKTPHSWRVAILPFLGKKEAQIYKQYRMNEPWDSEHNKKLIEKTDFFSMPAEKPGPDCGYFLLTGPGTAFDPLDAGPRIRQIIDGTSKTISVVEAKRSIPWTKPEDIKYDPDKPLPELGGYFDGGYNAAFFDGHVSFLSDDVEEEIMRALISHAGREPVAPP